MEKDAAMNLSYWDLAWPVMAGGALGLGARLGRWGYDLKTRSGEHPATPLSPIERAQIEVPVEVDEDEANELRREGIEVKTAADTVLDTGLQGLLGTAAAMGGWSLLDSYLDKKRRSRAEKSLERSRKRVQDLIQGMPDSADMGMARALKTACALYDEFSKQEPMKKTAVFGWLGEQTAKGVGNALLYAAKPLGIPLGIGAAVAAARAFNKGRAANKYRRRTKAIRDYVNDMQEREPMAVLVPVQKKKKRRENKPSANFTAQAGPDFGAYHPKAAAEEDDGISDWIWLALAGAAGAAGYYWIAKNPEVVKQYVPEWGHSTVDWMASSIGNAGGTIPAEVRRHGERLAADAAQQGVPEAAAGAALGELSTLIKDDSNYELTPEELEPLREKFVQFERDIRPEFYAQPANALIEQASQFLGVEPEVLTQSYQDLVGKAGNEGEFIFRDRLANAYRDSMARSAVATLAQDPQHPLHATLFGGGDGGGDGVAPEGTEPAAPAAPEAEAATPAPATPPAQAPTPPPAQVPTPPTAAAAVASPQAAPVAPAPAAPAPVARMMPETPPAPAEVFRIPNLGVGASARPPGRATPPSPGQAPIAAPTANG